MSPLKDEDAILMKAVDSLSKMVTVANYLTIPICLVVVVGNIFTIIIFIKPDFRRIPTSFFILALSITDILTLVRIIIYSIHLFGLRIDTGNVKIIRCIMSILVLYSPWMIVLCSFSQFIAKISIKWMIIFRRKKIQLSIILGFLILFTSINIGILLTDYPVSYFYSKVYPYVEIALSSVIPFVLITIFNILTFFLTRNSKNKINLNIAYREIEAGIFKVTVLWNILFLIFQLPQNITQLWGLNLIFSLSIEELSNVSEFFKHLLWLLIDVSATYWQILLPISQFFIYYALIPAYRDMFKKQVCRRHNGLYEITK